MTIAEWPSGIDAWSRQGILGETMMRAIFGAAVMLAVLAACGPTAPAAPAAQEIAKNSADLIAYLDAEYY